MACTLFGVLVLGAGDSHGQEWPLAATSAFPSSGVPLGFIENVGQWPKHVSFVARYGETLFRAESGELVVQQQVSSAASGRRGALLRLRFAGAEAEDVPSPLGKALPGTLNFMLGNDRESWRTGVRRYEGVRLGVIVPGVHAEVLALPTGPVVRLSATIGAALGALRLDIEGAVSVDSRSTDAGPRLRTEIGELLVVPSSDSGPALRVVADVEPSLRFDVPPESVLEAVVVDLRLEWSTYLGGSGGEYIGSVATDAQGRVLVAGNTTSFDFPTTPGAFDETWNGGCCTSPKDGFVACLQADGSSLAFATYLGGAEGNETPSKVLAEPRGTLLVTGSTGSNDFPVTAGVFKTQAEGLGEGFISRLSADGAVLLQSTYLGSPGSDGGVSGISILPSGDLVAISSTRSADYPTTPDAFDATYNGGSDGVLVILDSELSTLKYGTYFGGSWDETQWSAALRADGTIALCGTTIGPGGFPVTAGAFDTTPPAIGVGKGYVVAFDLATKQQVFGTYLAASPRAIAAHPDGSLTVAGTATGSLPVTPGAYDTTYGGSNDAMVLRLSADGSALHYATYLGGSSIEHVTGLALDSAGRPTVFGDTHSSGFPVTPGAFSTPNTTTIGYDLFMSRLEADGSRLIYSSRIGGADVPAPSDDLAGGGVVLTSELAAIAGGSSGDFPVTPGAYDTEDKVSFDTVVFKLTMLPTGAVAYGEATAGAAGEAPPAIGVDALPSQSASSDFAITCLSAPPSSAQGLLLVSLAPLSVPLPVKGGALWVDPSRLFLLLPAVSNELGYSRLPFVIPASPPLVGIATYWQYAWKPAGGGVPWPMSNALELTIQP